MFYSKLLAIYEKTKLAAPFRASKSNLTLILIIAQLLSKYKSFIVLSRKLFCISTMLYVIAILYDQSSLHHLNDVFMHLIKFLERSLDVPEQHLNNL